MRILLIEDSPVDVRLVHEHLREVEQHGLELMAVPSLARGLERLARETFDGLLLDLHLPDAAGLEGLERVVRAQPGLPVVVLTGSDDVDLGLRALQHGAQDYIPKHELTGPLLVRSLRHASERRQAQAELAERARRQAGLAFLARLALEGADLDELLREATETLKVTLAADGCTVARFLPRERFEVACGTGVSHVAAGPLDILPRSLLSLLKSSPSPVWVEDLAQDPRTADSVATLGRAGVVGCLGAAIAGKEGAFGAVAVNSCRRRRFQPDEVAFLEAAARLLSAAVKRVQTEEALQQSQQALVQSQKLEALGRLAGGVAHDFNNLLTAINCHTSLILRGLPEGDPLRMDLDEILQSTTRASSMTHQLLAFGRRQVHQVRLVDLGEVVDAMRRLLQSLLGEAVELVLELEPDLPVLADPGYLSQVVMNLAINARDAMPAGGRLLLETRRRHVVPGEFPDLAPGVYALLRVSDTGVGMPPEVVPRIFEPFFTTKAPGCGTGLGLSMVYGIVTQTGGTVRVRTAPGAGTALDLLFPLTVRAEAPPPHPPPPRLPEGDSGQSILVVEDERAVRSLLQRILDGQGYRVTVASGPVEALELELDRLDLLVTDLVMPGMSGRHLAERIRRRRPDLRVLLVSGYSEDGQPQDGVLDPETHFLPKPFSPDELLTRVREVLHA